MNSNFLKATIPLGLLILLFFITYQAGALSLPAEEHHTFSIVHARESIGTLRCKRLQYNDTTEYIFNSQVNMRFIFSLRVVDQIRVMYAKGQLCKASVYRTVNGRVKVDNQTVWTGKGYTLMNAGEKPGSLAGPLPLSTVHLYFEEPLKLSRVYSEKFQQVIPVVALGGRQYRLNLPNGHHTLYRYAGGVCQMVEADTEWATIRFVRQQ